MVKCGKDKHLPLANTQKNESFSLLYVYLRSSADDVETKSYCKNSLLSLEPSLSSIEKHVRVFLKT